MGVFKEEAHAFETIAKKQSRIFNDAADYGFAYNTKNPDAEVQAVIEAVNSLKDLDNKFPEERPLVRNRMKWGNHDNKGATGVSVDVIIFWEKDEEDYYNGTKYHISFNKIENINEYSKIQKDCDAFISVDIEPYSELA
jgi:hypothetical protein